MVMGSVLAGLVPAISLWMARPCVADRDRQVKPGDDAARALELSLQAVSVQIGTVSVEPRLGAVHLRTNSAHDAPEARRMAEFDEMRRLVSREIIEHVRRWQNQSPWE